MDNQNSTKPLLIVISSPSGAGKTSICKRITTIDPKIKISVSATTRTPRDNEIDGYDYHFISKNEFEKKIKNQEFAEYAKVFGSYYGSLHKEISTHLDNRNDVLFDIDWQGTQQLIKSNYSNIMTIFLLPPTKEAIEYRLLKRQEESGDDEKIVKDRMLEFETETSHQNEYDHIIVNDDFEKCVQGILEKICNKRIKIFKKD